MNKLKIPWFALLACPLYLSANPAEDAREILIQSKATGGLIVQLGCGNGKLLAELGKDARFLVHGLERDSSKIESARESIREKGSYGRVSAEHWGDPSRLPYSDNLVNLLLVEDSGELDNKEILRVLRPLGTALQRTGSGWKSIAKEWPEDIDEWTHFLHGPDGNAVSKDKRVGPPRHLQWVGDPKFSRAHEQTASFSVAVTSRGRMFYVLDESPAVDIRVPSQWSLIARDAFNGVILWKRPMGNWLNQFRRFRAGPANLPFRLVAEGDKVFVTMDFEGPVHMIDAATGKDLKVFEGTENTKQIIYSDGTLTLLRDDEVGQMEKIDDFRRRGEFMKHHCHLLRVDVETGKTLWENNVDDLVFPCMAQKDGRVFAQTPKRVFALDYKTGKQDWSMEFESVLPISSGKIKTGEMQWEAPTLVAGNGIVYAADFKKLRAYEAETGKALWQGPSSNGYNAPPDVLLINDLVWMSGGKTQNAMDPKTGEIVKSIKNTRGYMHARCYRNKGTENFIMMGLMGVQMVDLKNEEVYMNDWVRGTCQFGVMPANGMLYVPPDSCACNMKTKLSGIYALSSSTERPIAQAEDGPVLEKGPAYGKISKVPIRPDDWPTFRANPARSGVSKTSIPAKLATAWKNKIGGKLSALTVANGNIYVASVDRYEIHAVDEISGKTSWTFSTGGRIDSPPTIHDGTVYFGSADGWAYALRQTDGALAWRFRGGPNDRRVVVRGRLESAWPVHGNVLVHEGSVVVAAGRSSYLDGGIHLFRLDPETGKTITATTIFSPDAKGKQPPNGGRDVRGVLNDILLADGSDVYMRQCKLDFEKGSDEGEGIHLFTPLGFLDDTWWHRAYWVFNNEFKSHWSGWWRVGNEVPSGRILSYDDEFIFGFGRSAYNGGNTGQWRGGEKYQLFAVNRKQPTNASQTNQPAQDRREKSPPKKKGKRPKAPTKRKAPNLWETEVPLLATSLATSKDAIYLAGPPNMFQAKGASGETALHLIDTKAALAAWEGKKGGILYGASTKDGKKIVQIDLPAPTVFDGMAAANGSLYLALKNGEILCVKGE